MNKLKEIMLAAGMTQKVFAEYFGIPKRTVENWCAESRKCPEYLINLIVYKLTKENKLHKAQEEATQ